jgi:pimeloyl-ACP methyl ester carboxylesterase
MYSSTPFGAASLRSMFAFSLLVIPAGIWSQDTVIPRGKASWDRVACPFDTTKALLKVTCGRLKVPENRWDSTSRMIEVAFMRVSPERRIDDNPVIFLNGGPGSTSLWHSERLVTIPAIREIVVDRDWVFFDQRGGGRSNPALFCPPENDWFKRVTTCRDKYIKEGVNLTLYNSKQIAHDMEDLRQVLGVKQWNVWGASYGSRLAFTFARYHPASARMVIVDGPYLPSDQEVMEDLRGAEVVYNRLWSKCAADSLCAMKYPQLRSRFMAALPKLRAQPLSIGEQRIDDYRVVSYIQNLLYGASRLGVERNVQYALAWMDAAARTDGEGMVKIEQKVTELNRAIPPRTPLPTYARSQTGQNLSIDCHEEKAFESPEEYALGIAKSEIVKSFFPGGDVTGNFTTCAWWPAGRADPIENTHVSYDGPILAFTGELDANLSGLAGYKIEMLYANATHVVFKNAGHAQFYIRQDDYSPEEYVYRKCALDLARQFLADPGQRLDTRCSETRTLRLVQ